MYIQELLQHMMNHKASDLHLKSGRPPLLRINGELMPLNEVPPLAPQQVQELAMQILSEKQRATFEQKNEADAAYNWEGVARFRANIFRQKGALSMVLRIIPAKIPSLEELDVPDSYAKVANSERGLVLVTGATGSGKSTSLAAMINMINENNHEHIVTIEDPIEFLHPDKKCSVCQREVGLDTETFASALRYVLRQDPDIILIGEMRDTETVRAALSAAETGHMVFSTLHTMDTVQTLDRIIDFFPAEQHGQVRQQLAASLRAVICQRLVPRSDKEGRIPAAEVMVVNSTIRGLIVENRFKQITSFIKDGEQEGMMSFDQCLVKLFRANKISKETALAMATSPQEIELSMKGIVSSKGSAQSILSSMHSQQVKDDVAKSMDKGQAYMRRGMKEEAIAEFKKVVRDEPNHAEAQNFLNQLLGLESAEAVQSQINGLIRKGLEFFQEEKVEEAMGQWEEALKLDPSNAKAKAYIKGAKEQMQKLVEAKQLIQTGVSAYQSGNLLGALQSWEAALQADPHNEQAETYLVEGKKALRKMEDDKEAKQHFVNGANEYQVGNVVEAAVEWTWALRLKSEYQEAQEYLNEAKKYVEQLTLDQVDAAAPDAAAIQGSFRSALDHYINMRFKDAIAMLGQAKARRPTHAGLTEWIEKVKVRNRAFQDTYMKRASTALEQSDLSEAVTNWKLALKFDPDDVQARDAMAQAKPRLAQEVEKLVQEGTQYMANNRMREAVSCFEKALHYDPANEAAFKRLEEAREKYQKLKAILTQMKG